MRVCVCQKDKLLKERVGVGEGEGSGELEFYYSVATFFFFYFNAPLNQGLKKTNTDQ